MNKNLQTYAHEMRAFVMLNGETSLTELQARFDIIGIFNYVGECDTKFVILTE